MSRKRVLCICGHGRRDHHGQHRGYVSVGDGFRYEHPCYGEPETASIRCGCEGWQEPPVEGERLEFGKHRLPRKAAESAPAWPPLEPPAR